MEVDKREQEVRQGELEVGWEEWGQTRGNGIGRGREWGQTGENGVRWGERGRMGPGMGSDEEERGRTGGTGSDMDGNEIGRGSKTRSDRRNAGQEQVGQERTWVGNGIGWGYKRKGQLIWAYSLLKCN